MRPFSLIGQTAQPQQMSLPMGGTSAYIPNPQWGDGHLGEPDANGNRPITDSGKDFALQHAQAHGQDNIPQTFLGNTLKYGLGPTASAFGSGLLGIL